MPDRQQAEQAARDALSKRPRKLVTQQQAAAELGVCERTIRNWISRGHITGYRLPGGRAIRVDINEIQTAARVIPAVRHAINPYGPKAKIVNVPEVVDAGGADA